MDLEKKYTHKIQNRINPDWSIWCEIEFEYVRCSDFLCNNKEITKIISYTIKYKDGIE